MKINPFQSFGKGVAFLLVCGGIAVSNAATSVIINFGAGADSPDYVNSYKGSDVDTNTFTISGTDLKSVDGGTTGWKFSFTAARGGGTSLSSTIWDGETAKNNLDHFADSLGIDSLPSSIWNSGMSLGTTTSKDHIFDFEISNLTANATYEISFALGRDNKSNKFNVGVAEGTLQGTSWFDSTGASGTGNNQLGSGANNQQRITTFTVVANDNGVIKLTAGGSDNVYYSIMQFATIKELAIPETSTASLGLLALGGLMMARRRRA